MSARAEFNATAQPSSAVKRCCIIVAGNKRSERLRTSMPRHAPDSVAMTMGFLRLAARRATGLSSPGNVFVSAQESDRGVWEGPFWFTRPENRFISEPGTPTSLSTAAAVLSIATRDPSCFIAILPGDFWVTRESVLTEAVERAFRQMQAVPESVATLGMIDSHPEDREDYLVVGPHHPQRGALIKARINRPDKRLAQQLRIKGAMVASGILLGYAQAFAARIGKYWPHLARELIHSLPLDRLRDVERKFSAFAYRRIPSPVMDSARLSTPTFPTRAFPVQGSGWCSRRYRYERAIDPVVRPWSDSPAAGTRSSDDEYCNHLRTADSAAAAVSGERARAGDLRRDAELSPR